MSVAHDLNQIAEEKRKETARKLVVATALRVQALRQQIHAVHAGDAAAWRDVRFMAQEVIWSATPLGLGLLIACTKEVLYFTERRFAGEPVTELANYMESALDTLAMELERLRHDRDIR